MLFSFCSPHRRHRTLSSSPLHARECSLKRASPRHIYLAMNAIQPNRNKIYPRFLQCDSVPAHSWCCGSQISSIRLSLASSEPQLASGRPVGSSGQATRPFTCLVWLLGFLEGLKRRYTYEIADDNSMNETQVSMKMLEAWFFRLQRGSCSKCGGGGGKYRLCQQQRR